MANIDKQPSTDNINYSFAALEFEESISSEIFNSTVNSQQLDCSSQSHALNQRNEPLNNEKLIWANMTSKQTRNRKLSDMRKRKNSKKIVIFYYLIFIKYLLFMLIRIFFLFRISQPIEMNGPMLVLATIP